MPNPNYCLSGTECKKLLHLVHGVGLNVIHVWHFDSESKLVRMLRRNQWSPTFIAALLAGAKRSFGDEWCELERNQ